jgi:hypothetical protein
MRKATNGRSTPATKRKPDPQLIEEALQAAAEAERERSHRRRDELIEAARRTRERTHGRSA